MRKRIIKKCAYSALILTVSTLVIANMTAYEILTKVGFKR